MSRLPSQVRLPAAAKVLNGADQRPDDIRRRLSAPATIS